MTDEESQSKSSKGIPRFASVDAPLKEVSTESVNVPSNSSKGKTVSSKLTADD